MRFGFSRFTVIAGVDSVPLSSLVRSINLPFLNDTETFGSGFDTVPVLLVMARRSISARLAG